MKNRFFKTAGKYLRNRSFAAGCAMILFLFAVMCLSLVWTPYDPVKMIRGAAFQSPGAEHLLGTDNFGRDIFSRLITGAQSAFLVGTFTVLIGGIIGTALGSFAGYFGGMADEVIMRVIDAQMAFPGVLIALMIISIFGTGLENTIIALGIMSVPRFARMVRSGFLQYREADFVNAAKARGAGSLRIMYIHILPNILSQLVITASLSFATAILSETGLSYLGLGVQPPTPSWGMMLKDAQQYIYLQPAQLVYPGIMITIMVLGFNFIGDGLRDILDAGSE